MHSVSLLKCGCRCRSGMCSGGAALQPPVPCVADSEELDPDVADEQAKMKVSLGLHGVCDFAMLRAIPESVGQQGCGDVLSFSITRHHRSALFCAVATATHGY